MPRLMRPLLLLLLLATGCAAPCAAPPIRLLTFHLDGPPAAGPPIAATYNLRDLHSPSKLKADFRRLADVNLWALQEVKVEDNDLRPLTDLLPPGGWHGVAAMVNRAEAQAVLSRWPITSTQVWPLGTVGGKRRVALVAQTDAPGGPVTVVCVDIGPSWLDRRAGGDAALDQLIARLRDLPAGRAVVMGDFNSAGNLWRLRSSGADAAHIQAAMRGAGFAPCEAASGTSSRRITYRGGPFRLALDHAFTRGFDNPTAAPFADATGSDHLPLVVRPGRAGND